MDCDGDVHKKPQDNPPTYLHPTIHEPEDPHHADCHELPKTFACQLMTRKMLCYLIVLAVVLMLVAYITGLVAADYNFYSYDSGFPGVFTLIAGTLISLFTTTYLSYHLTSSSHYPLYAFWAYAIVMITYIFAILNLSTRTEYYVKNVRVNNNGSVWLIIALSAALLTVLLASQVSLSLTVLALVPVAWLSYLIYSWWFKVRTRFVGYNRNRSRFA